MADDDQIITVGGVEPTVWAQFVGNASPGDNTETISLVVDDVGMPRVMSRGGAAVHVTAGEISYLTAIAQIRIVDGPTETGEFVWTNDSVSQVGAASEEKSEVVKTTTDDDSNATTEEPPKAAPNTPPAPQTGASTTSPPTSPGTTG